MLRPIAIAFLQPSLLANSLSWSGVGNVIDVGTGTGALAIAAALNGVRNVVATDISIAAVENARVNVRQLSLQGIVDVRLGDGLSCLDATEKFDLILANLPGRNKTAGNAVAAAQWDTGFKAHRALFSQAPNHLAPGGSLGMVKANYPDLLDMLDLAETAGFVPSIVGRSPPVDGDIRTYYAIRLQPEEQSQTCP